MANPQPEGDFEEWKTLAPGLGLLVQRKMELLTNIQLYKDL